MCFILLEDTMGGMCGVVSPRGFSSYVDVVLQILIQKPIIPSGVLEMAKYVLAALEMSCPWGFSFGFHTNTKYFS